jgi:hypothetical protein
MLAYVSSGGKENGTIVYTPQLTAFVIDQITMNNLSYVVGWLVLQSGCHSAVAFCAGRRNLPKFSVSQVADVVLENCDVLFASKWQPAWQHGAQDVIFQNKVVK